MKKSLLALAVLGAFAGAASAQSSVTLFGTVDLNARYVKDDGSSKRVSMGQDGINSSQLGFKGMEDLGGGLKAAFLLLAGVNAETGTTNTKFFNRSAYVQLIGNFGEVRLGRDYTPTFWNLTIDDAFGTNGLGSSLNVQQIGDATLVRADNAIQYFLPQNIGGVYGQFMAAAGEGGGNGGTSINPGRYLGGRLGWAAGPIDIAGSYARQTFVGGGTNFNPDAYPGQTAAHNQTGSQTSWNIGGSYDFGVAKLLAYFDRQTVDSLRQNLYSVSGVVPLGQGEVHLGYDRSKLTGNYWNGLGVSNAVDQIKATYQYNLSKRTALYSTVSRLKNGGASNLAIAGGQNITALPTFGGKSTGAEVGIRHFF